MSGSDSAVRHSVVIGDVVIRVRDLGPEPAWHADRTLFGPWHRFEAELPSYAVVSERGMTPWEAVHRLVSNHRPVLERRWSCGGFDGSFT